jgi:hypothetical protein
MRVVAIFPGALGDLCLLAPSLAAVRARGAAVALSVQRSLAAVARLLLPDADLGPAIDGLAMSSLFGPTLDPTVARWLDGADVVHAWLARAADAAALEARLGACGAGVALHAVHRGDEGPHASESYAEDLGLARPIRALVVTTPGAAKLAWGGDSVSTRMVMHPGAGARAKVWAREGFQRVADDWRDAGREVAVLLGPAEASDVPAWTAAGHVPIVGRSIVDAAALLASAAIFVGNDSGVSHLAGALDRRGVVLFGPTRPARWRPLGGRLDVVSFAGRTVDEVWRDVRARLGALVP